MTSISILKPSSLRRMTLILPSQSVRTFTTLPRLPVASNSTSKSTSTAQRHLVNPIGGTVRWKHSHHPYQPRNKWAENPIVTYEELKPITQQPNDDILLIDVREPDEVKLGSIPSAVNLPLSVLRESLDPQTSDGAFNQKHAFQKPTPTQQIIFFCRSGKRSASAAEWAEEKGYPNVRNYAGSWLDWSAREKRAEDDD